MKGVDKQGWEVSNVLLPLSKISWLPRIGVVAWRASIMNELTSQIIKRNDNTNHSTEYGNTPCYDRQHTFKYQPCIRNYRVEDPVGAFVSNDDNVAVSKYSLQKNEWKLFSDSVLMGFVGKGVILS